MKIELVKFEDGLYGVRRKRYIADVLAHAFFNLSIDRYEFANIKSATGGWEKIIYHNKRSDAFGHCKGDLEEAKKVYTIIMCRTVYKHKVINPYTLDRF